MRGKIPPPDFEIIEDELIPIVRPLEPWQSIQIGMGMAEEARRIMRLEIADAHPEWAAGQVECEENRWWLQASFDDRVPLPYVSVWTILRRKGLVERCPRIM